MYWRTKCYEYNNNCYWCLVCRRIPNIIFLGRRQLNNKDSRNSVLLSLLAATTKKTESRCSNKERIIPDHDRTIKWPFTNLSWTETNHATVIRFLNCNVIGYLYGCTIGGGTTERVRKWERGWSTCGSHRVCNKKRVLRKWRHGKSTPESLTFTKTSDIRRNRSQIILHKQIIRIHLNIKIIPIMQVY